MSHKAHVFLKRPGQKTAKDIGVIEVDPAPGLHVHVTFTYMGKSEVGRINLSNRVTGGANPALHLK